MFHPYSDVPDVALKENTLTNSFQNRYSKQVKHLPQVFLMGR